MGTKMTQKVGVELERMLGELEGLADDIRVRLHLANLEAKTLWNDTLEPRLFEARDKAREASHASKVALDETVERLKAFSVELPKHDAPHDSSPASRH